MFKIEYLSSGNTLLSRINSDGTETPLKAFVPDSGVTLEAGKNIRIARQNGSDSYAFDWSQVKIMIGVSGALALPTTKGAFYKLLFLEFFIVPIAGAGSSTEAKQDVIIANQVLELANQDSIIANQVLDLSKQDIIIAEQQTANDLLVGGNRATTRMPAPVQANVAGVMYMMRTIRAKENVSVILKDLNVLSATNDSSFICVYVNPMIVNAAFITYTDMVESTKLEEGSIAGGNPTPQTITAMTGTYKYGMTVPKNDTALHSKLNIPINLLTGDVLCWTITPTTQNLDIFMFQSLLEK